MKTENELNRHIAKQLKRYEPSISYLKVCDRMSDGIPDFLTWNINGGPSAFEVKFIKCFPNTDKQILGHVFSGAQITRLETLGLSGCKTYGVIGVGELSRFYVFKASLIPPSGNWKINEFEAIIICDPDTRVYGFDEVDKFIKGHL